MVPWWLIRLRLALAPLLVVGAALKVPGPMLAAGLTIAFLSDVFDGIIARRVGASTPELRVADSRADVIFYLCVLGALLIYRPEPLIAVRCWFAALVVLQLGSWSIDRIKFHRSTALHSYTAKAWGITLFAAAVALFCSSRPEVYVGYALFVGYISNLEDIAIKLVLPAWHCDVGSFWHALAIRKRELRPR